MIGYKKVYDREGLYCVIEIHTGMYIIDANEDIVIGCTDDGAKIWQGRMDGKLRTESAIWTGNYWQRSNGEAKRWRKKYAHRYSDVEMYSINLVLARKWLPPGHERDIGLPPSLKSGRDKYARLVYRPGVRVLPDKFDKRPIQCSHGIHFFANRKAAIDYLP